MDKDKKVVNLKEVVAARMTVLDYQIVHFTKITLMLETDSNKVQ
jgi:hypothetical protein